MRFWLINTAIKEESYVSIFLSFCSSKLVNTVSFQYITKDINKLCLRECYRECECSFITCHCTVVNIFKHFLSVKTVKISKIYCFGYFTCSIRSVIKENNSVVIVNSAFFSPNCCRENKFIGNTVFIRFFNCLNRRRSMFSFTK